MEPERYRFRFAPAAHALLAPVGVVEPLCYAEVDEDELVVRFGVYKLRARMDNIVAVEETGPYKWWRALGVRVSLTDRGLTFGSNTEGGVCIRFREPVAGPFPGLRHPGVTITVAEPEKFANALRRFGLKV